MFSLQYYWITDITEDNVKREYLEDGSCFSYGKDKDGKKLFIIKSKLHFKGVKDFSELQRCIVYWFERLERYNVLIIEILHGNNKYV